MRPNLCETKKMIYPPYGCPKNHLPSPYFSSAPTLGVNNKQSVIPHIFEKLMIPPISGKSIPRKWHVHVLPHPLRYPPPKSDTKSALPAERGYKHSIEGSLFLRTLLCSLAIYSAKFLAIITLGSCSEVLDA